MLLDDVVMAADAEMLQVYCEGCLTRSMLEW